MGGREAKGEASVVQNQVRCELGLDQAGGLAAPHSPACLQYPLALGHPPR